MEKWSLISNQIGRLNLGDFKAIKLRLFISVDNTYKLYESL